MTGLQITYDSLRLDDLRGELLSDYLVAPDATLVITDDDKMLIDEPYFPIVELARSFSIWLSNGHRGNYFFDSMSFEEVGTVYVREASRGWAVGSVLAQGAESRIHHWAAVEHCVRNFIQKVESDLTDAGLDPAAIVEG